MGKRKYIYISLIIFGLIYLFNTYSKIEKNWAIASKSSPSAIQSPPIQAASEKTYLDNVQTFNNELYKPVSTPDIYKQYSYIEIKRRYHLENYKTANFDFNYSRAIPFEKMNEIFKNLELFITTINLYFSLYPEIEQKKMQCTILQNEDEFRSYSREWHKYDAIGTIGIAWSDNVPEKNEVAFFYSFDKDKHKNLIINFNYDLRRGVMFHECFHKYLVTSTSRAPIWFNEGMAECSASLMIENNKIILRVHSPNLIILKKSIRNNTCIPLEQFLHLSHKEWSDKGQLAYAESWGIVFFLLVSNNQRYTQGIRNAFFGIYRNMEENKCIDQMYKNIFQNMDIKKFEVEWRSFILTLNNSLTFPDWNMSDENQGFKLDGIIQTGNALKAIINRKIIKEGELIRNYTVKKIEKQYVVLKNDKKELILQLNQN